jgi:hypothetical protein
MPQEGLRPTQLTQSVVFSAQDLGFVKLHTLQRLGQSRHSHGNMEPVENGFAEGSEMSLRDSHSFTTIGQEGCRLGRIDALFGEKMRHPFGRLLLEPMDESEDITGLLARQTLANNDLKPSFLARRRIGRFDVRAIDTDGLQRMTLWQSELVELRLHG